MTDNNTTAGRRLRPQITATVHPDTVARMGMLCDRFRVSRGALIDKVVLVLASQVETGKVYCMTGEACRFNRQDVPSIL